MHAERRDRRDGRRIRDFDLCGFADRPDEPLEVTWHASEAIIQTGARILNTPTDAPNLTRSWLVEVPNQIGGAPFDVRRFWRDAPALVRELEAAGYTEFDTRLWFADPLRREALTALARLGCGFGRSWVPEDGRPSLNLVWGGGGWGSSDAVPVAVEEECKEDNLEKLKEPPDAQHRHLAVYVHSSRYDAFTALSHGDLGRPPRLPPPITTAWVLGSDRLYATTPPAAWEEFTVPTEVFDHPERWVTL